MELEQVLANLKDAGCDDRAIDEAKKLCQTGKYDELHLHFRRCRAELMDELHESQRKVDRLDYLIRQTEKARVI